MAKEWPQTHDGLDSMEEFCRDKAATAHPDDEDLHNLSRDTLTLLAHYRRAITVIQAVDTYLWCLANAKRTTPKKALEELRGAYTAFDRGTPPAHPRAKGEEGR